MEKYASKDYVPRRESLLEYLPGTIAEYETHDVNHNAIKFSEFERTIVTLICSGMSRESVARQLGITRQYLRVAILRIMRKINSQ